MTETRPVDDATARKSALTVGAVFLLIAAWNVYKGRPTVYGITGGAGALLLLTGLLFPAAARSFHFGWMKIAGVLGWINSRILLGVVFYGIMTPMGLVMRLFGRDPLDRRGPKRETYWIKRERTRQPPEQFERLF